MGEFLRLNDAEIESRILKLICNLQTVNQSKILSHITPNHFGTEQGKEVYARLVNLIQSGKQIPTTEVLKFDQVLSENARAFISGKANLQVQDSEHALEILEKYRKVRLIFQNTADIIEAMKKDSPDLESVLSKMESTLLEARVNTDIDEMMHIGMGGNADPVVEEILKRERNDFIPTGFKAFDAKSGGFAKKNVITIASVSGGGKSAMALQIACNQYRFGFNAIVISFEMDKFEIMTRILSNLGYIGHGFLHLRTFSPMQKRKVLIAWDEFSAAGEKKGNRLTIFCPTRDMTIQDVFTEIKPYGYDVIYIDYIGLLKQDFKKALWESLGNIARYAKLGANSLNAAVVLLAQLDEDTLKIKYSKALCHNSHFVWTWSYGDKEKELGVIEVNQIKTRNSKSFPFYLSADFDKMIISDYEGPPPEQSAKVDKNSIPSMEELV